MLKKIILCGVAFLNGITPGKKAINLQEELPNGSQIIGNGSQNLAFWGKSYDVTFTANIDDSLRILTYNFETFAYISYDYQLYYNSNSNGLSVKMTQKSLKFVTQATFKALGDSGPIPSAVVNQPIYTSVNNMINTNTVIFNLNNFDYDKKIYNLKNISFNMQSFLNEYKMIADNNGLLRISYNYSFLFYCAYYISETNSYTRFQSNRHYPSLGGGVTSSFTNKVNSNFSILDVQKILENTSKEVTAFLQNDNLKPYSVSTRDELTVDLQLANDIFYRLGFNDGFSNSDTGYKGITWLTAIFSTIDNIFKIEIFPGVKIWYIIAIPIMFSLVTFVLSFFR